MAQSLSQVHLHIVFSTKHRLPLLKTKRLQTDVHSYLAAMLKNLDCPAIIVGGIEDHIHFLCRLSRNIKIADLVRDVKKASSGMLHGRSAALAEFHWQAGYGAFSISPNPGCAPRPWALVGNAFGVRTDDQLVVQCGCCPRPQ